MSARVPVAAMLGGGSSVSTAARDTVRGGLAAIGSPWRRYGTRHVTGLVGALLLALAVAWLGALSPVRVGAASSHGSVALIDGPIDRITARYVSRAVHAADDDGSAMLLLTLDTPGGYLDATRRVVESLLASTVPVVVWVSPAGAQAASAGTFIAAAGHVAAMAPGTNIGAASPVGGSGEDLPSTLKSKATQDAAAFIRSIAAERGRNAEALEATVLRATSYSAAEALDAGVVDLVARDRDDLLAQLDGRTVSVAGRDVVLQTRGLDLRRLSQTPLERFLGFLANPNIAFVLLAIGGLGLLVEFLSPGVGFPGIAGGIALALAFVAMGNLPVNWIGAGLIAFAMVLFYLEMQAPGIGVFGIGGAVAFILGGFLLFGGLSAPPMPTPNLRVSTWVIGIFSAALFMLLASLVRAVAQSRRGAYVPTSPKAVGQVGRVTTRLEPRGTVQLASELWTAVSASGDPIAEGEEVLVLEAEGLTLVVDRLPPELTQEEQR